MMASFNSGCNISIRASVHLCKFFSSSQGYQKYSARLFNIYRKACWKTVLTSEAILRGLASIFIDSSFSVTWLHLQFKVFTRYSQYFWLLCIYLVGPCNFVNVICNRVTSKSTYLISCSNLGNKVHFCSAPSCLRLQSTKSW